MSHHHITSFWDWLSQNWGWVIFIFIVFGGAITGFVSDLWETMWHSLEARSDHKRKAALHQRRAAELLAQPVIIPGRVAAKPGECPHRPKNIVPVIGADGGLKSWLCQACDTQLPPTWAVREEDL